MSRDLLPSSPAFAQATAEQSENPGPNRNISRWAEGTYSYLTVKAPRQRGSERFYLNVHADGSRTMLMWHDVAARNAQFTVLLRANASFRPLEAFLNYWTDAGYKGSTHIRVDNLHLFAETNGPMGRFTHEVAVPQNVSLGAHPVSADGWPWYGDQGTTAIQTGAIYSMDATADLTRPALGVIRPQQFEFLGREKVSVPAGNFDALHYRLSGISDVWLMEQDRLMIRMLS